MFEQRVSVCKRRKFKDNGRKRVRVYTVKD